MSYGLTSSRRLTLLGKYMNEWIDAYPQKIKPFESWVDSYMEKKKNEGKKIIAQKIKTKCRYCRRDFNEEIEKTRDHVVPLSKFGLNVKENRVASCYDCNQWKADKTLEDWLKDLRKAFDKNKIKLPYTQKIVGMMIMNVKAVIGEVSKNKSKVSLYKK